MPIYSYKCSKCEHQLDTLQKMSDSPLTKCPNCGEDTLQKQITAAGFQLKGSGWYASDFKNAPATATPVDSTPTKVDDKPTVSLNIT